MSGIGDAAGAAIYAAVNIFSWGQALLVPGLQAVANIKILDKQNDLYEKSLKTGRQQIDIAVTNYANGVESLLPDYDAAFPDVPEAAEYIPPDPAWLQETTIRNNYNSLCQTDDYIEAMNRLHEQNDLIRAVAFDPRFLVNIDIQSITIQDLLMGRSPVGDVIEIVSDCAERAALTGRIGNTGKTLARDLGISKLRMQALGRQELRESMAMFNRDVSPISRQMNLMSMATTPAENIALALTTSQLIQNSLQNKNNTLAQKDPVLLAKLQTRLERLVFKLQMEASKGSMTNTHVPNYAAILKPQIDAVFNKIAGAVGDTIPAPVTNFFGRPQEQAGSYGFGRGTTNSAKSSKSSDLDDAASAYGY